MELEYVILEHTVDGASHFDLLMEVEGAEQLRTLQLERWPLMPSDSCPCRELAPHRRIYLTYEGEISGGRGNVRRVESGAWRPLDNDILLIPKGPPVRRLSLQANRVFCR